MAAPSSTVISQSQREVIQLDDPDTMVQVAPSCTDGPMDQLQPNQFQPNVHIGHPFPIDQLQPNVNIPHPDDEIIESDDEIIESWVDSVFYTIGVHAIIICTIALSYHHLNKGKDYDEFLEKYKCLAFGLVLLFYGMMALAEVWFINMIRYGRFLGRISHVFGFLAMFLILKLIYLPLALGVFIPTLIWGIIVVVYSFWAIIEGYKHEV